MHNWFAMETEAEFRRQEWARAGAADARSARALAEIERPQRFHLPRLALSLPKRPAAPHLAVTGFHFPNRRGVAT